ncbi:protein of unknown function [Kyrpidia spormannii]|uniref:Uncharacterized protein n=1 Tax=Kyrpidia spormannii TaxID=2055160 RepID=A0ACA8Z929_9BACL|nr:protein of unknown function [Kyrpidia spormannii]
MTWVCVARLAVGTMAQVRTAVRRAVQIRQQQFAIQFLRASNDILKVPGRATFHTTR